MNHIQSESDTVLIICGDISPPLCLLPGPDLEREQCTLKEHSYADD